MDQQQMKKDHWYKVTPPAVIKEKEYSFVFCICRVEETPAEYFVRATPNGRTKRESFILSFTKKNKDVLVTPAEQPSTTIDHLRLA